LALRRDAIRATRHTIHVTSDPSEAGRELSAALFGNRATVAVLVAIQDLVRDEEAFVTTRMVASATELGDSVVRPVMLRLRAAGVLYALPRTGGPRSTRYYQVQRDGLWDALAATCNAIMARARNSGSSEDGTSEDPGWSQTEGRERAAGGKRRP
jgi:hypothetical protein